MVVYYAFACKIKYALKQPKISELALACHWNALIRAKPVLPRVGFLVEVWRCPCKKKVLNHRVVLPLILLLPLLYMRKSGFYCSVAAYTTRVIFQFTVTVELQRKRKESVEQGARAFIITCFVTATLNSLTPLICVGLRSMVQFKWK